MQSISQITFRASDGKTSSLSQYEGKVLLVVNVASKCGLTPQYDALEKIFEKYRSQGFMVLAFPANEFAGQEPGTNAEIQEFCRMNFGVQFPVLEKIVVKGEGQHPLYKALTAAKPKAQKNEGSVLEQKLKEKNLLSGGANDIMWNFEKFLIGKNGQVVERFAPDMTPDDPKIIQAIEKELNS